MTRDEERQEPRHRVRIRGSLLINGRNIELSSENVSRRGVFFRSNDPVQPRQLVRLRLVLPPHDEILVVPAMVAHSVDPALAFDAVPGFGVRFVGLDGLPRETWLRFVRSVEGTLLVPTEDPVDESELTPYRPLADYAVCVPTVEDLQELIVEEIARQRILIPTEVPAVVGAPVRVHVVHPLTEEAFVLDGTVVRYEQGLRGLALVELVRLSDEMQKALFNFVHGIAIDDASIARLDAAEPPAEELERTTEASAFDPDVLEAMRVARESKTKMLPAEELDVLITASTG